MVDNAVVKRRLPCQLSEMEMADSAMLAATRQAEYDKVEEEKKRVGARYTSRLKHLRSEMSTEANKATTGIEERSVECMWIVDRGFKQAVLHRCDNREIVSRRDLTPREQQLSMMELAQWLEETAEAPATATEEEPEEGESADQPEELEEGEESSEGESAPPEAAEPVTAANVPVNPRRAKIIDGAAE